MDAPITDWQGFEDHLVAALTALEDADAIVVNVPEAGRESVAITRTWLGRPRERTTSAIPFVQYARVERDLVAECVGGPQIGGHFPFDDVEHAALLDEGWRSPSSGDHPGLYVAAWRPWPDAGLDTIAVRSAASLATRTLQRVFRAVDASAAQVERMGGG